MIRINIQAKKTQIKQEYMRERWLEPRVHRAIESLKSRCNFYSWFADSQGTLRNDRIRSLLLADSKAQLLSLIYKLEALVLEDARACSTPDSLGAAVKNIKEEIYDAFAPAWRSLSSNAWACKFLDMVGAKVCPYCNRSYTFHVRDQGRQLRPDLDHYFSRKQYPYLTVSIFNLVPSCSPCNKGKSTGVVSASQQDICYPYEEAFDDEVRFQTDLHDIRSLLSEDYELPICLIGGSEGRIDAYNTAFKISQLYNQHGDYAREVILKAMYFGDEWLRSICASIPGLSSIEEARQIWYGNYTQLCDVGKRPLAKLTRDILHEYGIMSDVIS